MYDNIGAKLKGLAVTIFILEVIGAGIAGLMMFSSESEELILAGWIYLIVGLLVAWISSWFLYAFGELVEKTSENEVHNREIQHLLTEMNRHMKAIAAREEGVKHEAENQARMVEHTHVHTEPIAARDPKAPYWCGNCNHPGPYGGEYCPDCGSSLKVFNVAQTESSTKTTTALPTDRGTIICSNCHGEQPQDRTVCWHCGANFE